MGDWLLIENLITNRNNGVGKDKYVTAALLFMFAAGMFIYAVARRW